MKKGDWSCLSEQEKTLCYIYFQFYQENPDFSKTETQRKAECMTYLLNKYGFHFGKILDDNYFLNDTCLVSNIGIEQLISALSLFGPIQKIDSVKLSPFYEKVIPTVGRKIREELIEENLIPILDQICTIDYLKNHSSRNINLEEWMKWIPMDISKEKISTKIKLIQKVNEMVHDMD